MTELWGAILGALGLGIVTSISPCPLATNIAAISYIGRKVDSPRWVMGAGILYTLGRMAVYLVLGVIVVAGLLTAPVVSEFLNNYIDKLLGPILIVAGMFLLELFSFTMGGAQVSDSMQKRVDRAGIWGAFLLGMLFALAFCPTSAALFFMSLIPLAVKHSSRVLLPLVYGIGTALPVVVFAILIAYGTQWIGKVYNKITQFEVWMRRATGVIFILVGVYYCMVFIFGVQFSLS